MTDFAPTVDADNNVDDADNDVDDADDVSTTVIHVCGEKEEEEEEGLLPHFFAILLEPEPCSIYQNVQP